jgi:SAM-dependent methyltransferase
MTTVEAVPVTAICPLGRSRTGIVRRIARVLDNPTLYNLWQTPFARPKMDYFLRRHTISRRTSVLDVGCGPASNTGYFPQCDYLGIDLDERYILHARRRFSRDFVVADALSYPRPDNGFDVVFFNGMLHHLDDSRCIAMLEHAASLLSDDGRVHVIDMILPRRRGIPRWLARNDRGEFVRPFSRWCDVFASSVKIERLEQFSVRRLGIPLLDMLYLQAKAR